MSINQSQWSLRVMRMFYLIVLLIFMRIYSLMNQICWNLSCICSKFLCIFCWVVRHLKKWKSNSSNQENHQRCILKIFLCTYCAFIISLVACIWHILFLVLYIDGVKIWSSEYNYIHNYNRQYLLLYYFKHEDESNSMLKSHSMFTITYNYWIHLKICPIHFLSSKYV
jgi:hypothetical protein